MPALLSVLNSSSMCSRRGSTGLARAGVLVAVGGEGRLGLELVARGVAQEAQGDDVAVALLPVAAGPDVEVALGVGLRVGVHLGPDQLPLAAVGVDHDRGLVGVEGARHVRDRDEAGAPEVQARARRCGSASPG